jgi:hypothetical protein
MPKVVVIVVSVGFGIYKNGDFGEELRDISQPSYGIKTKR